jgi:hypothetical protein
MTPVEQQGPAARVIQEHHMPELHTSPSFDFDSWATLARNNPQAFETKRNDVLEKAIQQAPAQRQQRLRCLQWKLDQVRHTAPTPMAATLRMQQLMWDSVAGESGLLARLQWLHEAEHPEKKPVTTAKIIKFPQ